MATRYKIHPGIGVARVGPGAPGYFLAGERLDGPPFELTEAGEVAFTGYKDASHLVRPQGVRFRVFKYDVDDATGAETLAGEVTPAEATVHWSLMLANRKAAGRKIVEVLGTQGEKVLVPGPNDRNAGVPRGDLIATAEVGAAAPIVGANQPLRELAGTIMGRGAPLGRVGTDHLGRLVVVGASGVADSWLDVPPPIKRFDNNDGWFDTVADGPVDAELRFPNGASARVDGAWVIIGPPDFAPVTLPVVSLHDVMLDALFRGGRLSAPARPSFRHDILSLFERAASIRWVNRRPLWSTLAKLAQNPNLLQSANSADRQSAHDELAKIKDTLSDFRLTQLQQALLSKWVNGSFDPDLDAPATPVSPAEALDRASLCRCVGSGFYPGIEMGFLSTIPSLYSEVGRFTRGTFTDVDGQMATLAAGWATERMALPWQADFMECQSNWWPVQRPDNPRYLADGTAASSSLRWDRPLLVGTPQTTDSHMNMTRHFARLGVIDEIVVGGAPVLAETGRDPGL